MPIETPKSAEPIDYARVMELVGKANADPSLAAHTVVECADDGRVRVVKQTASVDLDGGLSISDEGLQAFAAERGIPWDPAYAERVVPYWASDERVDRHGDIVEQTWDLSNFAKNPVVLWCHDWYAPPIGNVLKWDIVNRTEEGYAGPSLRLLSLFATAEQMEFADTIFRLAKARFLRTGSVGFYPGETVNVKDEAERQKLGLGRYGLLFRNNELVEWTIASVPANPGAHQILNAAKSAGLLKFADLAVLRELKRTEVKRGPGDMAAWTSADGILRAIWKQLYPEVAVEPHANLDEPLVKMPSVSAPAPRAPQSKHATPKSKTIESSIAELGASLTALSSAVNDLSSTIVVASQAQMDRLDEISEAVNDLRDSMDSGDEEPSTETSADESVKDSALAKILAATERAKGAA